MDDLQVKRESKGLTHKQPVDFVALDSALAETATAIEDLLDSLLPIPSGTHARVQEAVRYAVFAGGKRLRPFLVCASARLFSVATLWSMRTAAAIEVLHTYSLVHDDLPCMDDDMLRWGKPTTHVKFDEATALLAGDALLTIAFEILADASTHPAAEVRCALIMSLAEAAGTDGMIGGQMLDILAPAEQFGADEVMTIEVMTIQRLKMGALFEFACEAGAILGQAEPRAQETLRDYARDLGLAFQITDGLIDAVGSQQSREVSRQGRRPR